MSKSIRNREAKDRIFLKNIACGVPATQSYEFYVCPICSSKTHCEHLTKAPWIPRLMFSKNTDEVVFAERIKLMKIKHTHLMSDK